MDVVSTKSAHSVPTFSLRLRLALLRMHLAVFTLSVYRTFRLSTQNHILNDNRHIMNLAAVTQFLKPLEVRPSPDLFYSNDSWIYHTRKVSFPVTKIL